MFTAQRDLGLGVDFVGIGDAVGEFRPDAVTSRNWLIGAAKTAPAVPNRSSKALRVFGPTP